VPGLVPGIHETPGRLRQSVDGREPAGRGRHHNGPRLGQSLQAGGQVRRLADDPQYLSRRLAPKMGASYLMPMRIIARRTLRRFVESRTGHRDQQALKAALDAWFDEVRKAKWSNTADVKRLYGSASIVASDRIVFNIRGNAYRLVVAVDFEKGIVWIKWLGTHRDYDRIDVREVDHA
jgi:mRNA interferase HigB